MRRRTKTVLLAGGVAVAAVASLAVGIGRVLDHLHVCETGFSRLVNCRFEWSSVTTSQPAATSAMPSGAADTVSDSAARTQTVDITSWSLAECPRNAIARRLLCAVSSHAATIAAAEEVVTGLPLPKPWLLVTAKNSPFIESIHVETPLELTAALGFYRTALGKRGWIETAGAVIGPDRADMAFTTRDGPALLRLVLEGDTTIAEISRRKPVAPEAGLRPEPGQARLVLGNATDEAAVVSINAQTVELAGDARSLGDRSTASQEGRQLDLAPGRYHVISNVVGGAMQNRELDVAAGETWGLLVGPSGVLLPLHLY